MFPRHPLFDPYLVVKIISYTDGLGNHIERPIDLTSEYDEPIPSHREPLILPEPVSVQTHLRENGYQWFLILWSNGDRSWENIYFVRGVQLHQRHFE
jgi:hypothetical protein